MQQPAHLDFTTTEDAEWMRMALNGSVAELKTLLDRGMKPDTKTAEGTTALMLAARDLEKVKLLIEHEAKVNASATTGINPLMVAARYRGNAPVVRLLLKSGATLNVRKGAAVRNQASALFFAVMAGDVQTVSALLEARARLAERMKILGQVLISPLNFATVNGDVAMVE